MSDWWAASIKLQKQMLDAHRASLGAGEHLVRMQEAGRKAAEANVAALDAWAKLWGIGR